MGSKAEKGIHVIWPWSPASVWMVSWSDSSESYSFSLPGGIQPSLLKAGVVLVVGEEVVSPLLERLEVLV